MDELMNAVVVAALKKGPSGFGHTVNVMTSLQSREDRAVYGATAQVVSGKESVHFGSVFRATSEAALRGLIESIENTPAFDGETSP